MNSKTPSEKAIAETKEADTVDEEDRNFNPTSFEEIIQHISRKRSRWQWLVILQAFVIMICCIGSVHAQGFLMVGKTKYECIRYDPTHKGKAEAGTNMSGETESVWNSPELL